MNKTFIFPHFMKFIIFFIITGTIFTVCKNNSARVAQRTQEYIEMICIAIINDNAVCIYDQPFFESNVTGQLNQRTAVLVSG
jgi:hypothetical protein